MVGEARSSGVVVVCMLPLGEVDERSMCNELKACRRDKTSERIQNNNMYTIMSQSVLEFESWGRGGIIDYILLIPRQLLCM